jgi:hypothetical protein
VFVASFLPAVHVHASTSKYAPLTSGHSRHNNIMAQPQKTLLDQEKLKRKLQVSQFNPNSILRGLQMTLVGANRALQNPSLFTSEHYKQAALAVAAGIAIRLAISIPVRRIPNPVLALLNVYRSGGSRSCFGSCPSSSTLNMLLGTTR